jgi:two-component system, OmpR family, response regulator RegX3
MSERILVVEDEPAIAESVAYALTAAGYEVDTVGSGEDALSSTQERPYDLMILDLLLPGLSGLDVCREVRTTSALPIVMLTVRDEELDRVTGLAIGADDYVTKPFSTAELVSRVRAQLRRRRLNLGTDAVVYDVGGIHVDVGRHLVSVDGVPVRLTRSELRLLHLLAASEGRAVSREHLADGLRRDDGEPGDRRAIDVHISNLRRKLERDPSTPRRLVTVRGVGYRLVAS